MQTGTEQGQEQRLDAPLNSVARVLASLSRSCGPVEATGIPVEQAEGATCAEDLAAPCGIPQAAIALLDGRVLRSSDIIGASPMAPALLLREPPLVRVGDPLPEECDCVIDPALVSGAGAIFEAQASAAPGDNVRRAGEDLAAGAIMARVGETISFFHIAALQAAGISNVRARRPRVRVIAVPSPDETATSAALIASLARTTGSDVMMEEAAARDASVLRRAISAPGVDAIFLVGGSGQGEGDHAADALRQCGEALAHGLALDPGRTGGAALVDGRPALCLPGRPEGALGVYLALGAPLLRLLAGACEPAPLPQRPLSRKISSTVGLAQVALLQQTDGAWAPIAVGDITLSQILRADGYLTIAEGSEGLAEGTVVAPYAMPGRS